MSNRLSSIDGDVVRSADVAVDAVRRSCASGAGRGAGTDGRSRAAVPAGAGADRRAAPAGRPLADFSRWVVALRFPLALGGVLLALPALADAAALRIFLGNLFVLRTPELAVVAVLTPLAAWTAVSTARVVLAGAPARLRMAPWPWPVRRPALGTAALVAALSTPIVATALVRASTEPRVSAARLGAHALAVVAGGAMAAGAIALGERFGRRWAGRLAAAGGRSTARRLLRRLGPGYDDDVDPGLAAAHVRALGSAVVFALGYGAVGVAFNPAAAPDGCVTRLRIVDGGLCFPALGYVLVVAAVAGWALAGIAFWFDRHAVPTTLALALVALAGAPFGQTDHSYRTLPRPAAPSAVPSDPLAAADVVAARLARQAGPPRLVVVAASGGGTASALWTATVLTRLEAANGAAFTDALAAVSAVSGGSVGAMLHVAPQAGGGPRPPAALAAIRAAAAQPSLRGVAWGLAYPDLWRIFLAPAVGRVLPATADRGWAAERAWADVWHRILGRTDADATLLEWRAAVRRGDMPAPIFGAMAVETGRSLFATPIDLPAGAGAGSYDTFLAAYPDRDIGIVTAARISAAFPWISPLPRPDCACEPAWHVADGGFFDNDGVAGLLAFLEGALPAYRAAGGREVLVVQIRVRFDPPAPAPDAAVPRRAWPFALLGPAEALLSARGAVQGLRNRQALGLLAERWAADGLRVDYADAVFDLDGGAALPLSWQLTASERARVEATWSAPAARRAAAAVACFLAPR